MNYRIPMVLSRVSWYLLCTIFGFTMLVPLVWMVSIALKPDSDILALPPEFLPSTFEWQNFVVGPRAINFYQLAANTLVVTGLYTVGAVLSSMFAGYAIARIEFPGRKALFYAFVFTMFIPPIVTLVPLQRMYIGLGFNNTWWPLFLHGFFGVPLFIFLARQFFASIPKALDESALIDGATHLQIFTRIMLPLTKPLWITMTILAVQASWNDYINPLVYLQSPEKYTLSLGMASFLGSLHAGVDATYNYYMASNLLYMLPVLLLFFFAQRYFMLGLGSLGMTTK